jgi:hypothetical protein
MGRACHGDGVRNQKVRIVAYHYDCPPACVHHWLSSMGSPVASPSLRQRGLIHFEGAHCLRGSGGLPGQHCTAFSKCTTTRLAHEAAGGCAPLGEGLAVAGGDVVAGDIMAGVG